MDPSKVAEDEEILVQNRESEYLAPETYGLTLIPVLAPLRGIGHG